MLRAKETTIPIYDICLTIIKTDNQKQFEKFMCKHDKKHHIKIKKYNAVTYKSSRKNKGNKKMCLYVLFHRKANITGGLISHESLHVCDYIWEYIQENDGQFETKPYLLEYIVNETTKFLKSAS